MLALDYIKKFLLPLLATILLIYIILAALISSSSYQIISSFFLSISLIFYYSRNIAQFTIKIPIIGPALEEFFTKFQYYIVEHIPAFDGINFFNKKLLVIQAHHDFQTTYWPIYFLIMGFFVRIIIDKYIKHQKLRNVSSDYWLFITTYVVIASIISNVINWSFIKIIVFSIVIVLLLAAGLLRVLSDLFSFLLEAIRLCIQAFKIFTKWLALFLARIAKFIRNLVKKIRELYNKYIVDPILKFFKRIKRQLDKLESQVNISLDGEEIDDD